MNYELFEKTYATAQDTETTSARSTTARSKLRLDKEPLRTLSGSELETVGGGYSRVGNTAPEPSGVSR